jgi:hypothetical protein
MDTWPVPTWRVEAPSLRSLEGFKPGGQAPIPKLSPPGTVPGCWWHFASLAPRCPVNRPKEAINLSFIYGPMSNCPDQGTGDRSLLSNCPPCTIRARDVRLQGHLHVECPGLVRNGPGLEPMSRHGACLSLGRQSCVRVGLAASRGGEAVPAFRETAGHLRRPQGKAPLKLCSWEPQIWL